LKNCPDEIDSFSSALALPGVGESIADKIAEILESGKIRKLETLKVSSMIRGTLNGQ
jgi:DNA polymerase/3'-5' exonuclease PolX